MRRIDDLDLMLVAFAGLLAAAMAVLAAPVPLRLPIGIVAALVLPGYSVSMALFPPGELDGIERSGLAFSLSLGLIVIVAPLLDRSPAGLTASALVGSVTAITLLATAVAWLRRRDRAAVASLPGIATLGRRSMPGSIRPLMFAALGLVGVLFAVLLALGFVSQSGNATEFFLLGPGGTTEGLPVRVTSGTPVSVEVGISNHDGSAQSYRIVVESQAARLGAAGPISVGSGQMWTGDLDFTVPKPGRDQEIRILLYRGSSVEPYRVLMLTVEALAPTSTSSASRPVQPQAEDQEALAQLSEVDAPDFKLVIDPARQPLPHRRSVPSDAAYDPCHAPLLDPVLIRPSPSLKGGCYR